MEQDTDKKVCASCLKEDCENCVEEGGKSFCCQRCCDNSKKEEEKTEEQDNVCRFC